jgi:hypothetical protein
MTSNLLNREALENGLYNPPVDPRAIALQEIMETQPPGSNTSLQTPRKPDLVSVNDVPFELREHVEQFNSLGVYNPFHGVLANPTSCLMDPIRDDLISLVNYMDGRFSDNGTWTVYRVEFLEDVYGPDGNSGITGDLDSFEDHTDRLTNNLPSLAGIAQAALALDTVMNLLSNPCIGLSGFLGSIMDEGKAILNSIKNEISKALEDARAWVDEQIGPLIDEIKAAIAVAKAEVAKLIAMAKAEVEKFAKALLAQARQGLADLMANLPDDPCLRGLLGSVATGAAAAVING